MSDSYKQQCEKLNSRLIETCHEVTQDSRVAISTLLRLAVTYAALTKKAEATWEQLRGELISNLIHEADIAEMCVAVMTEGKE